MQLILAIRVENSGRTTKKEPLRSLDNWIVSLLLNLVSLTSTVNSYRGYWYLMDEYYLTQNYEASLLTGQVIGCLSLMALSATCSLHAGVFKEDKSDAPGQMVEFYYSSYFYLMVSIGWNP